jgi:hypothetical protein
MLMARALWRRRWAGACSVARIFGFGFEKVIGIDHDGSAGMFARSAP